MKFALIFLGLLLASCTPPTVETIAKRQSPNAEHVLVLNKINHHSTVPYVWEVTLASAKPKQTPVMVVARIIGARRVSISWKTNEHASVRAIGGRLDFVHRSACLSTEQSCIRVGLSMDKSQE